METSLAGRKLADFYQGILDRMDRPGWKKFAVAMVALALAFLLAVFSSVFAQEGRVLATFFTATAALALAGYVAFTAVPYLARRTRVEWLRVSLDYKLTREGIAFIAVIFVLAIAGLNTGNNLIYLMLSSMLAAILMSGILSLAVLTGVGLEILLPDHVFARRPVPARIYLQNGKKRVPSFSITLSGVGDDIERQAKRQRKKNGKSRRLSMVALALAFGLAVISVGAALRGYMLFTGLYALAALLLSGYVALRGVPYFARRARKEREQAVAEEPTNDPPANDPTARRILRQPLYFPFLPGAKAITRTVELEFPRRGLYREEGFALSTRFPFGFLEKKLRLAVSRDLWVYPAVEPTEEFYEILPMLSGELEAFQKGRGHDLYSIRDMLPTDSARHVDWKASARTRSLKVREFSREDERRLQLILDPRIGPPDARTLELFEAAVEFCACLAWHFYEVDAQLEFHCGDFQTPTARAGEIIYDILRHLAAVAPSPEPPNAPPPLAAEENVFRIICTALPRGSLPTTLWSRSYLVFFDALRPPSDAPAKPVPQPL